MNQNHSIKSRAHRAFTLVELLTVIGIIAVLAAFTLVGVGTIKSSQYKKTARAELEQIKTALENYHAKYGFYPPSSTSSSPGIPVFAVNSLYYELTGVNFNKATSIYTTLDNATNISVSDFSTFFYLDGIVNCSRGSAEDASVAKSFLPALPANRIANFNNVNLLVTSVKGPDATYQPLGVPDVNPFRYNSANPTNNPGSYDLWVDLKISGKTNRISNWNTQPQIVP